MKKLLTFRVLSILAMIITSLAVACPVHADGPILNKVVFDSWYTKGPSPDGPCPFTINIHETGIFLEKQWYDENGNLTREMYTYGGNIYYLSANDKTVTVQNSGTTKFTFLSPEETLVTISGQEWAWSIPGQGMVSGEIGKQTWSFIYDENGNNISSTMIKLVGNIMWTDVTPQLCGYLAP